MKIYKGCMFVYKPKDVEKIEGEFIDFTAYNQNDPEYVKKIKLFNKKKYIICAYTTYPDMLPVMLRANAIICEVGGMLSHSAIVAREFKIPCVIGVRNLKEIINNNKKIGINFKKEYIYTFK